MTVSQSPWALINLEESSPTSSYFLEPQLKAMGYACRFLGFGPRGGAWPAFPTQPDLVVICRYSSAAQLRHLQSWKRAGVKIVYFMDDDLLDHLTWSSLSLRYRWKLYCGAFRLRHQFFGLIDEFWVSTPYLAAKYAQHCPVLISPTALECPLGGPKRPAIRVVYHGTASHQEEIRWLLPVMRSVLERNDHIHFELFGARQVAIQFRKLPRTSVLHPLPWAQYLAYTQCHQAHIGLAPLLPTPFNAARAATKMFDYRRMGAVGIFSDVPPYRDSVKHGANGWLVSNTPARWVEAIERLANDGDLRASLLGET